MTTSTSEFPESPIQRQDSTCPVSSYNEWDPLEEVIVGRLENASIPPYHPAVTHNIPKSTARLYRLFAGLRYPNFMVEGAQQQLAEFIHILEAEGVVVRRPDVMNHAKKYRTPQWSSRGFCIACPRDAYLVVGDEIIETPMAWRSRYFESIAYRSLFKEYFRQGARWTAAPKPELADELFDYNFEPTPPGEPIRYVINETEPVFDAADFVRCGRDIFVAQSNVTNQFGIEWLRRHLGEDYRIHEIISSCRTPMHIDTTFMPLAPGKVLVNPDYIDVDKLPAILKSWDILVAPQPTPISKKIASMCSSWLSMNMLMLDEQRVIVEKTQEGMIAALKDWGFQPISCEFLNYAPLGGGFHCATLDVRRRGELQSYF